MYTLTILSDEGTPPVVLSRIDGGQSLLEICLAHGIEVPHRCGGICHCTSCHVDIEKGARFTVPKERREGDFLKRIKNRKPTSRLACQCLLAEGSGEVTVRLPSDSFHTHQP